jgi:predicted nucleotidyltransferase
MILEQLQLSSAERMAIQEAGRALKGTRQVCKVVLFGSKARGEGLPQSDIDLLILADAPVISQLRREVSECLARINLVYDVALTAVIVEEKDWHEGLIHYTQLYQEVQRDGCPV